MITGTIPDQYKIQFDTNWTHAAQQEISRFKKYAIVKEGITGKSISHNTVESEEMEEQVARLQKTSGTELATYSRFVFPLPHQKTTFLDEWDEALLGDVVLPKGEAVEAHRMASERKIDDIFLRGITGNNTQGVHDEMNTVAIPNSMKVAANYRRDGGSANTGLTLAKILRGKSIFGKLEVYGQNLERNGAKLCMAVSQDELDNLLFDVEQIGSADYNKVKALVDGEVDYFGGVWFIRSERLPIAAAGGGKIIRTCPMWISNRVHIDIWAGLRTKISYRDDLSEAIQIRSKMMLNACRKDEKSVVLIYTEQDA